MSNHDDLLPPLMGTENSLVFSKAYESHSESAESSPPLIRIRWCHPSLGLANVLFFTRPLMCILFMLHEPLPPWFNHHSRRLMSTITQVLIVCFSLMHYHCLPLRILKVHIEKKCRTMVRWEHLKEGDHREDLHVNERTADLKETWWRCLDWTHLAQGRDQLRALVKTVMNLRRP
jgi:hypothetical protein